MPAYETRTKTRPAPTKRRKYPKRLPRDPAKLFRWAAKGSVSDYEKLRELARKARHSLPTHIDGAAFDRITEVDRLTMIEEIQAAEEHDISAGFFLDGVNWLLDKVPWGNWDWMVSTAQTSINSMKGDGLNEVDEQYARLVGATYGEIDERPYVIDHWRRQVEFDSEYVSVWDNLDGHRLITVRGTQGVGDIGQDVLIGFTGSSTNLIGDELLQIIAATPTGVVVDLASHSLGTSLALEAYDNNAIYNAIHETYLYNPAYSPIVRGSADAYERDSTVRYFINTGDLVSMGSFGHQAPSNVVFRSQGDPIESHKLAQWQGSSAYQDPIYHAPPETKLQAHKVVYGSYKDGAELEQQQQPMGEDAAADEAPPGESAVDQAFDFGDVPEFDYGAL